MANSNEYMRRYMLERYERRRAAAIAQLGGKCVECGSTEDLHFDHVDPATKSFPIAKALASMSEVRLQAELVKCQLLCGPHHLAKTRAGQEWNLNNGPRDCACGRHFETRQKYGGHRAWCVV